MSDVYVPPGGPPQDGPPDPRILQVVGEEGIRKLLSLHYKNLEETSIRDMFAKDMENAAQRAADFFIQILGGTPYYSQKNGPPRMRQRHLPFPITEESRQVWLDCFRQAMKDLPFPEEYRQNFDDFLESFSAWMVNRKS
ncbi:MAG: bacitracin resistance protein BacA [Spirochaetia bacterium]|nr:bacitracin resistance protein BacA [Spirochaetia bacterium]